ncbi:Uncharacterised protein [Kingella potus]|uniref:EamA-like transporter family n=1 Tax=Kingella potus TaxID=265175 RepID=A0A377R0M7_9NEIS|nr:hypothetical protein [Kingella potus]STR00565.1 Uncharacterised protein [Kingella potus]
MKPTLLFLLLAALGNCCYHIGQKSLHAGGNPMLLLAACYAFALTLSLAAAPFFGTVRFSDGLVPALSDPRVWLVSLGTVMIELGFLMAYRSGGSAQWSGVAVNGAAALLLTPAGLLLFKEAFSWQKLAGIALTLAGIWLLAKD